MPAFLPAPNCLGHVIPETLCYNFISDIVVCHCFLLFNVPGVSLIYFCNLHSVKQYDVSIKL